MRGAKSIAAVAAVFLIAGCSRAPVRDVEAPETATPEICCPLDGEETRHGVMTLRVDGGQPQTFSWTQDAWPQLLVHAGEEIEVELGSEVPRRHWPLLALGLATGELSAKPLVVFREGGLARFILPADLPPGEYGLVIADPAFAVNSAIYRVDLQVVTVPGPAVDDSPAGLTSLLAGAGRVVLVAGDLPAVTRDLDPHYVSSLQAAMKGVGPPAPGGWPAAFPTTRSTCTPTSPPGPGRSSSA